MNNLDQILIGIVVTMVGYMFWITVVNVADISDTLEEIKKELQKLKDKE